MQLFIPMPCRTSLLLNLVSFVLALCLAANAQTPVQTPQSDDVVRINTDLVQTDVMVFDRKGRFVDGLKPDQFILTLSGEQRTISSLNRVTSGSKLEEAQLAAARSGSFISAPKDQVSAIAPSNPGRVIFFFVDDVHLSPEGFARSRRALSDFVEQQLNPNDQVAIVSTSGQIGFLQQLTDNPAVLRAAIARLNFKRNADGFVGTTRITEAMASEVSDGGNAELFAYLMESVKIQFGMGGGALRGAHNNDSGGQASRLLRSQIGQIRAQSRTDTASTLEVLRNLMQSAAALPGRKLIFLMSDGFIVDPRGPTSLDLLHQVTQVAANSGTVIYAMDTRGNFSDAGFAASNNEYVDLTSRHAGVSIAETMAPREPLSVLADETAGRAIFNGSSITNAIDQAIKETSDYYVLAWRPDADNERTGKARMEVSIQGRPDLRVRLRRSYFVPTVATKPGTTATVSDVSKSTTPEAQLLSALGSAHPLRSLPTSLSVGYVKNSGAGYDLQASMQIARAAFDFDPDATNEGVAVDVVGAAIDDRGLIYTFKQVLRVMPQQDEQSSQTPVVWTQQLKVQPGLYQVRVAVRDRKTGRSGSALQWVEVPAVDSHRLSMSSLFLGERHTSSPAADKQGPQPIRVDVDHSFARTSVLRFQTYVYNASRDGGSPDVWIEALVLRGNQQVLAVAPSRIPPDTAKDSARLPYWTEISLDQLPAGRYTLQVSATDRTAKSNASQRISFSVD